MDKVLEEMLDWFGAVNRLEPELDLAGSSTYQGELNLSRVDHPDFIITRKANLYLVQIGDEWGAVTEGLAWNLLKIWSGTH